MIDLSPSVIGPALAGLLTIAVLSYIIGDNALFRLGESASRHICLAHTVISILVAFEQTGNTTRANRRAFAKSPSPGLSQRERHVVDNAKLPLPLGEGWGEGAGKPAPLEHEKALPMSKPSRFASWQVGDSAP